MQIMKEMGPEHWEQQRRMIADGQRGVIGGIIALLAAIAFYVWMYFFH